MIGVDWWMTSIHRWGEMLWLSCGVWKEPSDEVIQKQDDFYYLLRVSQVIKSFKLLQIYCIEKAEVESGLIASNTESSLPTICVHDTDCDHRRPQLQEPGGEVLWN